MLISSFLHLNSYFLSSKTIDYNIFRNILPFWIKEKYKKVLIKYLYIQSSKEYSIKWIKNYGTLQHKKELFQLSFYIYLVKRDRLSTIFENILVFVVVVVFVSNQHSSLFMLVLWVFDKYFHFTKYTFIYLSSILSILSVCSILSVISSVVLAFSCSSSCSSCLLV